MLPFPYRLLPTSYIVLALLLQQGTSRCSTFLRTLLRTWSVSSKSPDGVINELVQFVCCRAVCAHFDSSACICLLCCSFQVKL